MDSKSWEGGLRSMQSVLSPSDHIPPRHMRLSLEKAGRCIWHQCKVQQQLSRSL